MGDYAWNQKSPALPFLPLCRSVTEFLRVLVISLQKCCNMKIQFCKIPAQGQKFSCFFCTYGCEENFRIFTCKWFWYVLMYWWKRCTYYSVTHFSLRKLTVYWHFQGLITCLFKIINEQTPDVGFLRLKSVKLRGFINIPQCCSDNCVVIC